MKLAIMQPYFFPYLGYFQLINFVDKFVIYDDVNFINRGWINRNQILVNGTNYLFTIPCKKKSPNKLIKEVEVSIDEKTKLKILKTIERAYSKSPFFSSVFGIIIETLNLESLLISDWAVFSLKSVLKYLSIEKQIVLSSERYENRLLKGSERIMDICKEEKSLEYINLIGGRKLYNKESFSKNGIKLDFIKMNDVKYKQFNNSFVPNLSIIDVMMFNSKNRIKELLTQRELI